MRATRVLPFVHVVVTCGCGAHSGAPSSPADAHEVRTESSSTELTPGEQCLADAAAEREPPAEAPESIVASHILVRHAELERPQGATRSREAACLRALEALKALEGGSTWDDAVGEYSDAGSATAGSLGSVTREDVAPAFGNAAFALEPEQLSYVVETDRGFHVILREE